MLSGFNKLNIEVSKLIDFSRLLIVKLKKKILKKYVSNIDTQSSFFKN